MTAPLLQKSPLLDAGLAQIALKSSEPLPQWLLHLKANAAQHIREYGMPHPKEEAWRFAPLATLLDVAFEPASQRQPAPSLPSSVLSLSRALSVEPIVMFNGRLVDRTHSSMPDLPEVLAFHLGRNVSTAAPFAALNTAMFSDVLWLKLSGTDATSRVLYVVHTSQGGNTPQMAYDRVMITAEPNSHWTVIEHFVGLSTSEHATFCSNAVSEVVLGPHAEVEHVRIYEGASQDMMLLNVAVRQEHQSRYVSRSFSLSGALRREDVHVVLADPHSECDLEGVYVIDNADFSGHYTAITHAGTHTRSKQHYRGVLGAKSQGVFDGTIVIARDAQDSHAHQENRNVLLSTDATIHTKPQLQIDADNVKCSHGATVGHLDDAQLFYLRSRGVGVRDAKTMLLLAFLESLVKTVDHLPLQGMLVECVRRHLPAELAGAL